MTVANSNTIGLNSSQIIKIHQESNQFGSAFLINLIQNLVSLIASRELILDGQKESYKFGIFFSDHFKHLEFRSSIQMLQQIALFDFYLI